MAESRSFFRAAVIIVIAAALLMGLSCKSVAGTQMLPSGLSLSQLEKETEAIISDHLSQDIPGLALAVIQDGKIVFLKGYGYADIDNKIKIDPSTTVFEYGSINKLFVWVNAMQLKERGQLSLDLPVEKYLPENFTAELDGWEPFTIRDLMNHMAGFEDPLFYFAETNQENLITLREALIKYQPEQVFSPGEIISYSNYGTSLAAYVIKKITGKKYHEFLNQHIFIPADMSRSFGRAALMDPEEHYQNKAIGYVKEQNEFIEAPWVYVPKYPSGAANGTILDLARFALALMPAEDSESILFDSQEFHKKIFSQTYAPENDFLGVAHGFWEYDGEVRSLAHGGTTAGFSGLFSVSPETGTGLAVLTNVADETEVLYALHKLIFGEVTDQEISAEVSEGSAFKIEGLYLPARSSFTNFMEIFTYLSAYQIEAVNDREFILHMPGYKARYIEVEPNHYRIYDSSNMMITYLYTELFFSEQEAGPIIASSGNSADLLAVDTFRSSWYFNMTVIAFLAISALLLIMWILFFIRRDYTGVLLAMALIIVLANNYLLLYRGLQILYFNPFGLQIHLLLNWLFLTVAVLFTGYLGAKTYLKSNSMAFGMQFHKEHSLLLVMAVVVFYLLYDWNFFILL